MRQFVRMLVGVLLLIGLVGCSGNSKRSGTITGKITYKGQPVNNAALLMYPAGTTKEGDAITIPVTAEGEFIIQELNPGEYHIVVQGAEGNSQEADLSKIPENKREEVKKKLEAMRPPTTIKFPDKYKKLKTTTLKIEVNNKDRKEDLELKD